MKDLIAGFFLTLENQVRVGDVAANVERIGELIDRAIAEQVALLDIACGGRFILTVGQGYRPEEFAAFGVPFEERLARTVDGIAVLRRLWSEREVVQIGRAHV